MFANDFKSVLSAATPEDVNELTFISIDANGVDMRIRMGSEYSVERLTFGGQRVEEESGAIAGVRDVLQRLQRVKQ